jgi:cell division GTPase FtsZ
VKFWDEANSLIFKKFKAFYDLSKLSGTTAFDVMDYKGMFDEKGCLVFAEDMIPFNDNENALASAVIQSWRNTVFLSGDVTKSTAVAVIVQRPPGFDKGGKEINELYEAIKRQITSGKFCRGVYFTDNLLDKAADSVNIKTKPVKISSVVAGIAFPLEKIKELQAEVDLEMKDIKAKQQRENIDLDLSTYLDFVGQVNDETAPEEIPDFTIFKESGMR